ncbi:hypothetical protein GCM10027447_31880 [Glycomyces halotolerans]
MESTTLWEIPGWGLVFAAWAVVAAAGVGLCAVTALVAWSGRRKRRKVEDAAGGRR